MTQIEKLLINLIKIPSVSGDEKRIADFIVKQLRGFKIKKQFVSKNRYNIIARKGNSKKWLVAHMDTIPGQIPIKITKERIFGRGTCDNKQSVAASIIVGNQLNDINLLFTVGEEKDFIGAKISQKLNIKGNLVIVQEPTKFKIVTGQRGAVSFKIKTTGKKEHSKIDKKNSATHKLITILSELQNKKWTGFNIGVIKGGIAENVVADNAEALISARPKSIEEHKRIIDELKKIKKGRVVIKNNFSPSMNNKFGFPENIAKVFSETAFFKNSIQFGGGDIKFAHGNQEHILRKDLNLLPQKLTKLITKKL